MSFRDLLGKKLLFFDGGMGTMLHQAGLKPDERPESWNMTRPDDVSDIHRAYLRAGCDILTTNTFGSTPVKLEGSGLSPRDVVSAAINAAKKAIATDGGDKQRFIALDVGPTGKLLEPVGDLGFERAVECFKEQITAGAGADLILIETMSDSYELKAAVLAAKECSTLPIVATVTLDRNKKLLTGGDISSAAALLEGLGVDALGFNCGFGPVQMLEFLDELEPLCSTPIVLTPNAGIPREDMGKTVYDISPDEFGALMSKAPSRGAQLIGGCCGTTPAHMEALIKRCEGVRISPPVRKARSMASGYGRTVILGDGALIIGERINPTGKPRLKQALRERDFDHIIGEGVRQIDSGAHALDVNSGLPDIDEAELLPEIVRNLQSAIDAPLVLDSANIAALERAMRIYNGKPIVNSVNGKDGSMNAVFPLIKKYGGILIALTLDENGIPETAQGRVDIARRIIERAEKYGIDKKDILVDTLTMGISSGNDNARVTLDALSRVKAELGVNTVLGVSNVSFGLPERDKLNSAFLAMAMTLGLSAAIINPNSPDMLSAYHSVKALSGLDPQCGRYISIHSTQSAPRADEHDVLTLEQAVKKGLKKEAADLAKAALKNFAPLEIIEASLVPALDSVGSDFECGKLFLPQLLMSAQAAKSAFDVIQERLGAQGTVKKGLIIIATVEGDIHDIGKNIAKAMLLNYQFDVIDLGKDVPPDVIVRAAIEHDARLVGLSALMTTTVASMEKTIIELKRGLPDCKVMVGGAVLTGPYAKKMGADRYVKDAMAGVRYAQEVFGA